MTLSFKTHNQDGSPTDFVLRIWDGLILNGLATQEEKEVWTKGLISVWSEVVATEEGSRDNYAKIHSIRADPHDRWKAGMPIHFVINNRRPDRIQFAPVIPCVSVQKIRIEKELIYPPNPKIYPIKKFHMWIDDQPFGHIDGIYDDDKVEYISQQDGFLFDFLFIDWWPIGVFEGKIIHWTNFRYNNANY